jgi:flagellar motor switch protein FliN
MSLFAECWVRVARDLFHQALAGEPVLIESEPGNIEVGANNPTDCFGASVILAGDEAGTFSVLIDSSILEAPLLGEGAEQKSSWAELLRETFEAACGELLAKTGKKCRVEKMKEDDSEGCNESDFVRSFRLRSDGRSWRVQLRGQRSAAELNTTEVKDPETIAPRSESTAATLGTGLELLLDVELEASLRFGCREMPLGEILDLGPGDVVQLDRHVADPVDLIVGDKIVARGEVVLVNGNFGLRISEVAAPTMRLESIRCLF